MDTKDCIYFSNIRVRILLLFFWGIVLLVEVGRRVILYVFLNFDVIKIVVIKDE